MKFGKNNILTSDYRVSIIFIIPALISVGLFLLYPFVYTLILSLSQYNLMTGKISFIGLGNYQAIFSSRSFINSLSLTVVFAVYIILTSTILGVLFALLLNQNFIGRAIGRAVLILPWAIPWVVIGIMWRWMLNAQWGSLNGILYQLGIIDNYISFLSQRNMVLFYAALPAIWRQSCFSAILLLASIQTTPDNLYESAMMDGAGAIRRFFSITLPWMMPTLVVVLMFNTLYGFMQFDTVFMLTRGGPGSQTEVLPIHLYRRTFESLQLGQGAAIGYVLSMLCIGFGLFFTKMLRKVERLTS